MTQINLFVSNEEVAEYEAQLAQSTESECSSTLIALAWSLRQRDCNRALGLLNQVQPLLDETQTSLQARVHLIRAEIDWLFADLSKAEQSLEIAMGLFRQAGDSVGVADGYLLHTMMFHDLGCLQQRNEALNLAAAGYLNSGDALRCAYAQLYQLHLKSLQDAQTTSARLNQFVLPFEVAALQAWQSSTQALLASVIGDVSNGIKHFSQAYCFALESGQIRHALLMACNTAESFATLGDLYAALEWIDRALGQARSLGWPRVIANCLVQTGNILRLLKRHAEAENMLDEALKLLDQRRDSSYYHLTLMYLGELALDAGEYEQAYARFYQIEQISNRIDNFRLLRSYRGQADALCRLKRQNETVHKAGLALALAQQEQSADELIKVLTIYVAMHRTFDLPDPPEMTAPSAEIHYLHLALDAAARIHGYLTSNELYDQLAEAYAKQGDFKLAYEFSQRALRARDQQDLHEAQDRAVAMQVRYETERVHAEIEHHKQLAETESKRALVLQEANTTLQTLGLIGRKITACLNTQAVCETLSQHVSELLAVSTFSVYQISQDAQVLRSCYRSEPGMHDEVIEIAMSDPRARAALCARERREIAVDVIPGTAQSYFAAGSLETLSLLFAPLLIGERLLGVLTIQTTQLNAYGEREKLIFRTLCAYGAIALDNANAYLQLEATLKSLNHAQQQLLETSITDPLTGLRNRRFLMQQIENDIALSLRRYEESEKNPLTELNAKNEADLIFFILDLDHFKAVNDVYGHAAGDMVLVQIRQRLQSVFRESDYMVRWGGEEFLLVARAVNRTEAQGLAERIRLAIAERPFELTDNKLLEKTCSVGFACFPFLPEHPRLISWQEVVALADQALYMAKHAGRNCWVGLQSLEQSNPEGLFQNIIINLQQALQHQRVAISHSQGLNIDGMLD